MQKFYIIKIKDSNNLKQANNRFINFDVSKGYQFKLKYRNSR